MKIIEPFDPAKGKFNTLYGCRNAIFLAGPCPRTDFSDDWRFEAFKILDRLGFGGTVITPTNSNFKRMTAEFGFTQEEARESQVAWETEALHLASAVVFWIPRDEKHPARTTNVEFGEWYKEPRVFAGWPEGAEHNEYLRLKLASRGKPLHRTLSSVLADAVMSLSEPKNAWFTADTHFCQKRTLELSRRPFRDTAEMDRAIISNWNKRVAPGDLVVHAGDFMDPDAVRAGRLAVYLGNLNFGEMHWVLGNYDRKCRDEIEAAVFASGRDVTLHDGQFSFKNGGRRFVVVHEPNDFPIDAGPGDVVLFGHIHGRAFAKRNGFDLGTDYHQYSPISIEQVGWFANAMKYWDQNVYSDACNAIG